mmetsp:Transcript_16471/g.48809  ORF Transcript_16471/g.48809 Transcript_16471/m.48809 type:complete len:382 (-) Transcript_16471:160-1305(-)
MHRRCRRVGQPERERVDHNLDAQEAAPEKQRESRRAAHRRPRLARDAPAGAKEDPLLPKQQRRRRRRCPRPAAQREDEERRGGDAGGDSGGAEAARADHLTGALCRVATALTARVEGQAANAAGALAGAVSGRRCAAVAVAHAARIALGGGEDASGAHAARRLLQQEGKLGGGRSAHGEGRRRRQRRQRRRTRRRGWGRPERRRGEIPRRGSGAPRRSGIPRGWEGGGGGHGGVPRGWEVPQRGGSGLQQCGLRGGGGADSRGGRICDRARWPGHRRVSGAVEPHERLGRKVVEHFAAGGTHVFTDGGAGRQRSAEGTAGAGDGAKEVLQAAQARRLKGLQQERRQQPEVGGDECCGLRHSRTVVDDEPDARTLWQLSWPG